MFDLFRFAQLDGTVMLELFHGNVGLGRMRRDKSIGRGVGRTFDVMGLLYARWP
jgi:hypothetical protein